MNGKTNTKVKGNAESSYRTGDVNLTYANIGACGLAGRSKESTVGTAGGANQHVSIGVNDNGHWFWLIADHSNIFLHDGDTGNRIWTK